MYEYTVAHAGLSLEDRLVLRSTLRLLSNESVRWTEAYAVAEPDVLLLGPTAGEAPVPGGITFCIRASASAETAISHAPLRLPLRACDLADQLHAVRSRSSQLIRRHDVSASSAAAVTATHRRRAVLDALLDKAALQLPMRLRIGSHSSVTIDRHSGAPSEPMQLHWRSWTTPSIGALCKVIATGEEVSLDPETAKESPMCDPVCSGRLFQLIWAFAAYEPQPVLDIGSNLAATHFSLGQWPDFGSLPVKASHVRLAALLVRRPMTLAELVEHGAAPNDDAVGFLNACHRLGWLRSAVQVAVPPLAAPAKPRGSSYRNGVGALLQGIRQALWPSAALTPTAFVKTIPF